MERDPYAFPFFVESYYGNGLKLRGPGDHRKVGDLAISTQHKTEHSARMDYNVGRFRDDIGRVVISGPKVFEEWVEGVEVEAVELTDPEYEAKQKAKLFGEFSE